MAAIGSGSPPSSDEASSESVKSNMPPLPSLSSLSDEPASGLSISEGKTIAEPLQDSRVFPGMMVQMVAVGEETGSMEIMLTKIADFYDDEVDTAVAGLTSLLEPLMLVFMGGSIGTILIAMYLPIFTIADSIN